MTSKLALLACLLLICAYAAAGDDVNFVIAPANANPSLPSKLVVFFPGGNVPNTNYTTPLVAVQEELKDSFNVFVSVLGFKSRKCIQVCPSAGTCFLLHNQVTEAISQAVEQGFDGDIETDVVMGGHSLGGTCVNQLVSGYSDTAQYSNGMFLWGSYIDESGEHGYSTDKPFALIGAELDGGLARPGKMATWVYQAKDFVASGASVDEMLKSKAVFIIPGIDHSNFCPGFDVPGDIIPSDVDDKEALKRISRATSSWLLTLWGEQSHDDTKILEQLFHYSLNLLAPYFEALNYEVMYPAMHYLDEALELGGSYSPLCEDAQMILAGFDEDVASRVHISRGCDLETFDDSRSCAYLNSTDDLEHSRSQYAVDSATNDLFVNVSAHASYYRDFLNTGSFTAAKEVACKMLTGARMAEQLGVDYDYETSRNTCKDVNQNSIDIALKLLEGSETLNRYQASGKPICLKDDFDAYFSAGPAWIKESLEIKETDECLQVSSVKIDTALDSKLFPGVHYCKLLSPARVIDWIMTDSNANKT